VLVQGLLVPAIDPAQVFTGRLFFVQCLGATVMDGVVAVVAGTYQPFQDLHAVHVIEPLVGFQVDVLFPVGGGTAQLALTACPQLYAQANPFPIVRLHT